MAEITAAASSSSCELPEDVVLEILVRVSADAATLFRCAATCKRWRGLVAGPSFLRRCWPEDHPISSLVGFIGREKHRTSVGPIAPRRLFFVPPPGVSSILGARRRLLASAIIRTAPSPGFLDGADPIVARDGLLLVRCSSPAINLVHMAVCDLLAGTCHVLPPLKCKCPPPGQLPDVHFAIFSGADQRHAPSSSSAAFFKVLALISCSRSYRQNPDKEWNLYTFSSSDTDKPRWSKPRKCLDELRHGGDPRMLSFLGKDAAVVCRGVAHWFIKCLHNTPGPMTYYTFEVSAETGQASLTELSSPANQVEPFTATGFSATLVPGAAADGSLLLLRICKQQTGVQRLETWARDDDSGGGGGGWIRTRAVELKLKPPTMGWHHGNVDIWPVDKSRKLLINVDSRGPEDLSVCIHSVDVETGSVEEHRFRFRDSRDWLAVPVEIDWPTLFASRLG